MSFDSYRESRDLYGYHKRLFWDINFVGACLANLDKGGYDHCFDWPKVENLGTGEKFEKEMP